METKKHAAGNSSKNEADREQRIQKKAKSTSTMESSVAAELKNREHGAEKPAR